MHRAAGWERGKEKSEEEEISSQQERRSREDKTREKEKSGFRCRMQKKKPTSSDFHRKEEA